MKKQKEVTDMEADHETEVELLIREERLRFLEKQIMKQERILFWEKFHEVA